MSAATVQFKEIWRYQGWETSTEYVYDGAIDSFGNLILAGVQGYRSVDLDDDTTFVTEVAGDFSCVKLSGSTGAVLWTWSDSSFINKIDSIFGVDTDSEDNVILGGSTEGFWDASNPHHVQNIAVMKLNGVSGAEIWRYQDVAPDSSTSLSNWIWYGVTNVFHVAVDPNDSIFLTGQTTNSLVYGEGNPGDLDWYVRKLNGTTAVDMWTVQGGSSYNRQILYGAVVDASGNVVAAGVSGEGEEMDFLAVKLSGEDGEIIWTYAGNSFTPDILRDIAIDGDGNVYVAGGQGAENFQGFIADYPVVIKLDGDTGDEIWYYTGISSVTGRAIFYTVDFDPITRYVVAAGHFEETTSNDVVAVVLDDQTGDELSVYQNGTTSQEGAPFVGFDLEGHLFLGGHTDGQWANSSGDYDFFAVKFELLDVLPTPAPVLPLSPGPITIPAPTSVEPRITSSSPVLISAPTSTAGGSTILPTWKIGAAAGGASLFLLLVLLALCKYISGSYMYCYFSLVRCPRCRTTLVFPCLGPTVESMLNGMADPGPPSMCFTEH